MYHNQTIPPHELYRIMGMSEFDLEYLDLETTFEDLAKLAAKVAGTDVSLINLVDAFTQWGIASFGIRFKQMPRKDSVCQHTIMEESLDGFEVKDLSQDGRFSDKFNETGDFNFKYYFGVPLKTKKGINIGALCVLDPNPKFLSPRKKELLTLLASEIVNRLEAQQVVAGLKRKVSETIHIKNKVAHDIRGPIGGIIGLAKIIQVQGHENKLDEVLEFTSLIKKSGESLLELTDEILSKDYSSSVTEKNHLKDHEYDLMLLKSKLFDMYQPQAKVKNIYLGVEASQSNREIPFPKNKLLQILGNLISNSIKFTPESGQVDVFLELKIIDKEKILHFSIKDSGVGMDQNQIDQILKGEGTSTLGTQGEIGFGFGLNLVQLLVKGLKGEMVIQSQIGKGVKIEGILPVS